jgi:tetratricopeptide (TPR) repeat protein
MSKNKSRLGKKPSPSTTRPLSAKLIDALEEADSLMQRGRLDEAIDILESADRRYPNRPEVLTQLMNAYHDVEDMVGFMSVAERLSRLRPNDPDLMVALAGAYAANLLPVLALRTFHHFLDRWPEHAHADEARKMAADLGSLLRAEQARLDMPEEAALELLTMHDTVQSHLAQGKYREARQAAEDLLRRHPNFAPALNNISQAYYAEGRLDQAISTTQRVLAFEPENVHALSNLTRYLCLSGHPDEARQWADRLKASTASAADVWLKKMEALAVLGDDEGALDVFDRAERAGALQSPGADPTLYHLAAVAALRLEREADAREYWKRALKVYPDFELARDNLDDLRKPARERHAPWAFGTGNWLTQQAIQDLIVQIEPASRRGDDSAIRQAARRYLRKHPEMNGLAPVLLDRGDPDTRGFALRLALMAETPEMLAALSDFALGQRGPDEMRFQAAQAAANAGLLPPGPMRLWQDGEWREILLLGFEIHGEPLTHHRPPVEQWALEAMQALRDGDSVEAERLLKQALEIEPDQPDLLNNLAAAYELQGRTPESRAMLRQIHEQHPDYLFARTGLARLHVQNGQLEEARALLEPLWTKKRWHFSEYASFCSAQIELLLAEGNREAAQSWLEMWADADPDHPDLRRYRGILGRTGRLRSLFRRPARPK